MCIWTAFRRQTLLQQATCLLIILASGALLAKPPGGGGGGSGGGGGGGGTPPAAPPSYTINYLGTLGGSWSMTYGMNNNGDVVGAAERADGSSGPFVYTPADGMLDLNRLIPNTGLDSPRNMVWGPDVTGDGADDLYVASAVTDEVLVYDGSTGDVIGAFISAGSGGLDGPHALAFRGGDLYVSGRLSDAVHRYDGATGAFIDTFVPGGSAGLDDPVDFAFGPDGHLYVISQNTNEILAYDGADGSFLGVFVGDDPATTGVDESGGVDEPFSLLFADGVLYVTSFGTNEVLTYDGGSGAFLGVFVAAGSGGLLGPRQLTFGPDGNLYVANGGDNTVARNSVLRYDGQTGAFIDEFVAEQSGGLKVAMGVLFDASGRLLVTSRDTDQILVYEGPFDANPGAFIDAFVPDVGWILLTARDINDAGQIVGYGYPDGGFGEFVQSAYRYTPPGPGEMFGTVENLGVPGPMSAQATAINNDGDVAGQFVSDSDGVWHSFLWMDGGAGYQDLGTLAGARTLPMAINDRIGGDVQVAGYGDIDGSARAWRYDTATGQMLNLGVLKGNGQSRGLDLNNLGQVTGWSTAGRQQDHAFIYSDGAGMQDLGTLSADDSEAYGINDSGAVVGLAQIKSGEFVAMGYSAGTGMFELEPQIVDLDTSLLFNGRVVPWRINNSGQICGPGGNEFNFYNIHGEAYVITPVP